MNLFISAEVSWPDKGIGWRQTTGFPGEPRTQTVFYGPVVLAEGYGEEVLTTMPG